MFHSLEMISIWGMINRFFPCLSHQVSDRKKTQLTYVSINAFVLMVWSLLCEYDSNIEQWTDSHKHVDVCRCNTHNQLKIIVNSADAIEWSLLKWFNQYSKFISDRNQNSFYHHGMIELKLKCLIQHDNWLFWYQWTNNLVIKLWFKFLLTY